ncbi:restriction endonuclease subunit S [Arcobacter arenosus]|uniref:restriction endonuclease subunit S n=1 Tax=Arcobacter arenosus TaxID=2576037 RepID=UPI003BAC3A5E
MITKSKTPQIRFKDFSGEWNSEGFDETFLNISNNNLSRAELNYNAGLAKNVHYGDVLIKFSEVLSVENEQIPFITNDEYVTKFKSSKLQDGDMIIADAAEDETVGKCTEIFNIKDEMVFSGLHTIAVRPNKTFASKYLGYYMNSPSYHNQLLPLLQGTKVLSISKSAIKNTNISSPSDILEQTKIGNYFQQLDKLIEQKEKKYQKLKQFKKAMLDKMFPKNGADTPEIRFKGFSGKWEEKKLGDLIEFIVDNRGKNPRYYCNEGIPVIDNFMIKNNYHPKLSEATRYIDENLFNNFIRKYIEPYDTVITLVGNGIGNITLVPKEKSVIIQNTLGLRFSNDKIFMFYCLLSKNREIKHLDRGMAQPSIRQDELLDIEIKTPKDLKEQEKIGNYFQKLDKQIDLQQKEIKKLKNIKKASLDKMFI